MMSRYFLAVILSFLFAGAPAYGQEFPPVGTIDVYGLQTVSEKQVLSALKIKAGDDAIKTLEASEENRRLLLKLPNVEDAAIGLVCCNDLTGKSMVYVGVREKGAAVLSFRPAPKGSVRLPESIMQAGKDFQAAFDQAITAKDFTEDDSQGHALFGNKAVSSVQKRFVPLAAQNLNILRRVLRESADAGQRALAAQIIAYAPNKKAIIDDLVFAVMDAGDTVRNNATRSLIVIAIYAQAHPGLKIEIPANDFVRMLNSLNWTDRNKSLGILNVLSKNRDASLLAALKTQAFNSLVEMAGWKNPGHAIGAFFILGRVQGFSETEIEAMWKSDNRAEQIQKIAGKK